MPSLTNENHATLMFVREMERSRYSAFLNCLQKPAHASLLSESPVGRVLGRKHCRSYAALRASHKLESPGCFWRSAHESSHVGASDSVGLSDS